MITTEVKNRVVILQDKTQIPITRQQEEQIMQATTQGITGMYIGDEYVKLITINRISDYFPEPRIDQQSNYRSFFGDFKNGNLIGNNRRREAIEGIKKGLLIYINSSSYQGTDEPTRFVALCDERFKEI